MRARLTVAFVVAAMSALYAARYAERHPRFSGDVDHLWYSATLLRDGQNPYEIVGTKGLADPVMPGWRWRLYYPLPAVIAVTPFTVLPRVRARVVFVAVCGFVFAFAITRHRWEPITAVFSGAYLSAIWLAQWSPLVASVTVFPWLGFVIACKPNIGLVALAGIQRWRDVAIAVGGAASLALLAFLILPSWLTDWRSLVATNEHYAPLVTRPFGWLPLLALYHWRRPEARMLAALTLIPMTPGVREALFVWLAPLSWWQGLALAASSHFVTPWVNQYDPGTQFPLFLDATAHAVLWLVYVPATVFILVRRERLSTARIGRGSHRYWTPQSEPSEARTEANARPRESVP